MGVHRHRQRRSFLSNVIEKILYIRSTKRGFSSVENAEKIVARRGIENIKPYVMGNYNLASKVEEHIFDGIKVFTLNDQSNPKQRVILYMHGGAWTNQPLIFHWKLIDKLAQALNAKIIAPIYPKVPHYNYKHTYPKLMNLYKEIFETVENPNKLTIMGDSSGGNISLALALLLKENNISQPKDIILLSACVDLALDNPLIEKYEDADPMLSVGGMKVTTRIWAADKSSNDPLVSPINGDLKGLGKITQFIGTREVLYPDAMKLDEILTHQGIETNTFIYPKMNHVFVVMPTPEAKDARQKIADVINDRDGGTRSYPFLKYSKQDDQF